MTTCFGIHLAQFLQRVESALLAHADVHHDEVGMMLARHADALVARLGAEDFERLLFQQAAEGIVDVLLVVDDEDGLPRLAGESGRVPSAAGDAAGARRRSRVRRSS